MGKPSKKRQIKSAYDAFYFLRDHPKLNRRERDPIEAEDVERLKADARKPGGALRVKARVRFVRDKGGNWWREWLDITVPAVTENFDIHYTQVDERGRVNKDESKNIRTACWLELGQVRWEYHQPEYEAKEGARCYKVHHHDVDLDCGAATFDEALIKLARLVQKKYGDFPVEDWQLFRPSPPPRLQKSPRK